MVNLVYFGAELSKEVGDPLIFWSPGDQPQWVDRDILTAILDCGTPVTIRPATFAEFLRVESQVALAKIGAGALDQLKGVPPGTGAA
jgi:hypothetical protein